MEYCDDFYDGLRDTRNILFRQIDTVAVLNKLSATITSEIQNTKNYRTNVIGPDNYTIKHYLNNFIHDLEIYNKKINELIKIKNGFPIFNLGDIETISLIKTNQSMDYKSPTIINNLINELKVINTIINESISSALKENDYQVVVTLGNIQYKINLVILNMPK